MNKNWNIGYVITFTFEGLGEVYVRNHISRRQEYIRGCVTARLGEARIFFSTDEAEKEIKFLEDKEILVGKNMKVIPVSVSKIEL